MTDGPARLRHLVRTRATALAVLVLVVGSLLLSAAHVRFYPQLSPVDELQHIDYLYRAPEVIRDGEKVEQEAMREQACRTLANYVSPPCSDTVTYVPEDFQELGTNTAAIYTPLYYTVTKIVATPIRWVLGPDSLVTAGRLVGGIWLAAGLVMTFVVARRLGAHRAPTVALLLAGAATPNVLLPSASITPDAAALLAGASLVWSVLWWEDSPRRRLWLPVLLSLLVVSLKAINILVVVLVALYILLRYVDHRVWPRDGTGGEETDGEGAAAQGPGTAGRDAPAAPTLLPSVLAIALVSIVALGGAAGYVLFTQANEVAASVGVSMAETSATESFPLEGFATHVGAFLLVFYAPGWWVTVPVLGPLVQSVLGLVVFAGTFAAAFVVERLPRSTRVMAVSLLVVGVVGAPLIIAFSFVSSGMYVPIPGRYALTLVPAGLAVASASLQRPAARVLAVAFGAASVLLTLAWMLW